MFGDLDHDTGGSSGAASCASTTLAWLGRLKRFIAGGISIVRWFQRPTTKARRRWSGYWGRTGEQGEGLSPYMPDHVSMRVHTVYMRAAQQEIAKDWVDILAIRLMYCQIRSRATRLIGRMLCAAQPPTLLEVLGIPGPAVLSPDSRVEKLLL